jgi:antitoxin ParD1/3/4
MSIAEKRTFSLPAEHAAFIDEKIASGAYASGSEVVRAGLRALQERDAAVENWLRNEVIAAYDALDKEPGRAIEAKEAFSRIRNINDERLKARK